MTDKCAHLELGVSGVTPEEREARKKKRALHRFFTGHGLAGDYLLVTLTTPAGWVGDIHDAWRRFLWRARRRGLFCEYYAVREFNADKTCEHIHAVFRVDYLGAEVVRQQWRAALGGSVPLGTVWTHHKRVRSARGLAFYLAKYLAKGESVVTSSRRYWYSGSWVVPGWVSWSRCLWRLGTEVPSLWYKKLREDKKRLRFRMFWLFGRAWADLKREGFYLGSIKYVYDGFARCLGMALRECEVNCANSN